MGGCDEMMSVILMDADEPPCQSLALLMSPELNLIHTHIHTLTHNGMHKLTYSTNTHAKAQAYKHTYGKH